MKLRALSSYDGDKDTRFGDCILIFDNNTLVVYDCGHERHANEVKNFLQKNRSINRIHIVISHNDSDHTDGVINLLDYLYENRYEVTLYSSLYLKNTKEVLEILDDKRRTPKATREHILEIFDKICDIVQKAEEYNFSVVNAEVNTSVSYGTIVGPKVDEFAGVVAAAIDANNAGAKIDGETVMNAASVQLKIKLDNACLIFTPIFLPICRALGMNTIHFGIMMIFNLCIGTITPPVGTTLFVGVKVGKTKIEQVIRPLLYYFGAIFIVLMLVSYIPQLSLWLPGLMGYV